MVVESKKHPHGRIVRLENYTHPEGVYKPAAVDPTTGENTGGGLIPGLPIFVSNEFSAMDVKKAPSHALSVQYKQWRWENFWQKDLRYYIGRGMQPHFCVNGASLNTEWQQSGTEFSEASSA